MIDFSGDTPNFQDFEANMENDDIATSVAMERFAFLCETGLSLEKEHRVVSEYDDFAREAWAAASRFMVARKEYFESIAE